MPDLRNPGGTPGGLGLFLGGCGLSALGSYLLFSRVIVSAGYWWQGPTGIGLGQGGGVAMVLLPFFGGIAFLFRSAESKLGWCLLVTGLALLVLEIILSLRIHFQPTPLTVVLLMVGAIAAGVGMVLRSLK
jgi:hypothetical protein